MKLGVLTALYADRPLEAVLDIVKEAGLDCVELGAGNYPGDAHLKAAELLESESSRKRLQQAIASRGLEVSALACHGNPLHPRTEIAQASHAVYRRAVELAQKLEVPCVNLFSGCPGDSDQARFPNWVTCAWPTDFQEVLDWQWREKVIPYWKAEAAFAAERGVRLGFEMHPGFVVYNPATLLRLREACGDAVGANFDPSHLFWQGIDVPVAIAEIGRAGALHHVHAKDTAIDPVNTARNGVLDTTPLDQVGRRSWVFRTVGYGHGEIDWKRILTALRLAGYEGALSIEHEDALFSVDEGFRKCVAFLRQIMPSEPPLAEAWWTH
ncbi:MAG: sugar phosphate isomerase/epimerase [Chloroflexi bacterium]|nr:MAG: sugar phosphate isomerase/epimerase [Chloroflexota bacterium]TME17929.1 MAG: sugar phosphate isomerase/epimerase [Chloroflexota bacterium]